MRMTDVRGRYPRQDREDVAGQDQFTVAEHNRVWAGVITDIWTAAGW
jgi:hypothetical protein